MRRFACLIAAASLAGCAVPSPRANIVVVTTAQAVVEKCTSLGVIDGDSEIGRMLLTDQARDAALRRLKIRAAERDGTHVLSTVADPKWKGPGTGGTLYRCP